MGARFSPSVYEHAAFLLGKTPWEVSRDPGLLYRAHREAFINYGHSPVVVGIDIYNVEAEAYGAGVGRPSGAGVPAITSPAFGSLEEAMDRSVFKPAGRIPAVLEAAGRLAEEFPGLSVKVPVSGPFSIAAGLLGLETLLEETLLRPDLLRDYLFLLAEGQVRFCREIRGRGLDAAFFESAAAPPLLSPGKFREVEFPPLAFMLKEAGGVMGTPVSCIIGGDTLGILEHMLETGARYLVCPSETDQRSFMDRMKSRPEVTVRINMDAAVIRDGSREDIAGEIERVLAAAGERSGLEIGTGAVCYDTPPENIKFVYSFLDARDKRTGR